MPTVPALARLHTAWLRLRRDNAAVADEIAADNLRRIQWLAVAVVLLNLAHVVLFGRPAVDETAVATRWREALWTAHLGMGASFTLVGAGAGWLRRHGAAPSWAARAWSTVAVGVGIGFVLAIVCIDQSVTPNITPFVVGCGIAGVIVLMRPGTAAVLYAGAFAAFFVGMGLTQADPVQLLSNRVNGLTATVMGWLMAALAWHKTAQNLLLTRQLAQRQRDLERHRSELQAMASRDGLTGLVNRTEMLRMAHDELSRARRQGQATAVLVLDLDHFKQINDGWGHPVGDAVLQAVAERLRSAVRATDVVARLGGEEFMILLPHTARAEARGLAERLRRAVADTPVAADGHAVPVTASIGIAAGGPDADDSFADLYAQADRALYRAKAAGRNRCEDAATAV